MRFTIASEPTPGRVNEDYAVVGQDWAVLLDGATAVRPEENGCIHDVPWLTHHLAGELARTLTIHPETPLPDTLAAAITATCEAHESTCDLTNPDSPSSTVTILRRHGDQLDYLALADSPLLLNRNGAIEVVTDDRMAHLTDYSYEAVIAAQNTPEGYYVASTMPEAAYKSVHGSLPASSVDGAALLTDGASRLVDFFERMSWAELFSVLLDRGPAEVIARTRHAEINDAGINDGRRRKAHDDATAIVADLKAHRRRYEGVS